MSKITSKLQLTVPKALADEFHLGPGDEVTWVAAGESLRLIPAKASPARLDVEGRLKLFDAATARLKKRRTGKQRPQSTRGWSREELYDRGLSR